MESVAVSLGDKDVGTLAGASRPVRDPVFACVFLVHVASLMALCLWGWTLPHQGGGGGGGATDALDAWMVSWLAGLHGRHLTMFVAVAVAASTVGLVWALFVVSLLRVSPRATVWLSCSASVVLFVALGVFLLAVSSTMSGVLCLIMALLQVVFVVSAWSHVAFGKPFPPPLPLCRADAQRSGRVP